MASHSEQMSEAGSPHLPQPSALAGRQTDLSGSQASWCFRWRQGHCIIAHRAKASAMREHPEAGPGDYGTLARDRIAQPA